MEGAPSLLLTTSGSNSDWPAGSLDLPNPRPAPIGPSSSWAPPHRSSARTFVRLPDAAPRCSGPLYLLVLESAPEVIAMVAISLRDVRKVFPDGTEVLEHFELDIGDGELMVLVGPSGSGKTTVLRLIAGLETPTAGSVLFDDRPVHRLNPAQRNVSMVFQDGALIGHLSARANIAFPLRIRHVAPLETDRRVEAEATHVGIRSLLSAMPGELSAGHRHAVATARAIIRESDAFLLDEPLAALDARARQRVRAEVVRLHRELGSTMVYVTNDTAEAMAIGDRIAVLGESGQLLQVDTPTRLFSEPVNTFVASFIGPINLITTLLEHDGGFYWIQLGHDRTRLSEAAQAPPSLARFQGKEIIVGIRPHHLSVSQPGAPFDQCVHGVVAAVSDLGADLEIEVGLGPVTLAARTRRDRPLYPGDPVELRVHPDRLLFFDPVDEHLICGGQSV